MENISKQLTKAIIKIRYILILIFILSSFLTSLTIDNISKNKIQEHLNNKTVMYTKAYQTIYNQYAELSQILHTEIIDRSHLDDKLYFLMKNENINTDKLRKEIYISLRKRFLQLEEKHIASINVILPDDTIFLKMKNIKSHSHKISKLRHLPSKVNEMKIALNTFETGVKGSGFRFAYPIHHDNTYVGLLCFTFDAAAITSAIMRDYYVLSNFFIDDKYMNKEFIQKNDQYIPSNHQGYLFNKEVLKVLKKVSRKDIQELLPTKETTTLTHKNFHSQIAKTIYDANTNLTITTIPIIHKITHENQAVLTIRSKDETIPTLTKNYNIITILSIIILATLFFIAYITYSRIKKDKAQAQYNFLQEKRILEQAKFAQMGEMVGNIAHQWRQPLSTISTTSSGMKLILEMNDTYDKDQAIQNLDMITDTCKHLSETINHFMNFIKEKRELQEVIIQERIQEVLYIVGAALENNHIQIRQQLNIDNPMKIKLVLGELSQVLLNIINNSKDALVPLTIDEKWIQITCKQEDNKAIITIEDNAGGIPEDIIDKVFDPYFTTKHQTEGTGIGLYMSKNIIEKNLKGKLYVKNTQYGAKTFIELPIEEN